MTQQTVDDENIRRQVREHYGKVAAEFQPQSAACGGSSDCSGQLDAVPHIYEMPEAAALPEEITGLSMGCGDPVTLASLEEGQTVLDLGSGAGIDCFLAAQRVGETGRVIGVDMTAEMVQKARANRVKVGAQNVEFRLGEIEHLPVADSSADVIISNCVINLSPDKPQVFREAFRALKPGGKLAISDIMTDKLWPEAVSSRMDSWAGCVGGAMVEADYLVSIKAAGFVDIEVERVYPADEFRKAVLQDAGVPEPEDGKPRLVFGTGSGYEVIDLEDVPPEDLPRVFSGKIRARKPSA